MNTTVMLDHDDFEESYLFGTRARDHRSQTDAHFLSLVRREKNKFLGDMISGKLAEFAFSKFAGNLGMGYRTVVNTEEYPDQMVADNHNDLDEVWFLGKQIKVMFATDIKKTKEYGNWLLVEDVKYFAPDDFGYWNRRYILVKLTLEESFYKDPEAWYAGVGAHETRPATIAGYAKAPELRFELPAGSLLWTGYQIRRADGDFERLREMKPGGSEKARLDANNHAWPAIWLHNIQDDWRQFFNELRGVSR